MYIPIPLISNFGLESYVAINILCLKTTPQFFENRHKQVVLSKKSKIDFNSALFSINIKFPKKGERQLAALPDDTVFLDKKEIKHIQ